MKEYKCTLDSVARFAVPGLVLLIIIMVIVTRMTAGVTFSEKSVPVVYFVPALLIGLFIAMYLLKPLSINADSYSLTIDRKIKPVVIEFSDIQSIRKVADMRFAIRTFGNGGLFGYTGKYYKKGIGSMTWYCTQTKNYLLIEKTNGKKIVITPDDADGFMQDIAMKQPQLLVSAEF